MVAFSYMSSSTHFLCALESSLLFHANWPCFVHVRQSRDMEDVTDVLDGNLLKRITVVLHLD